MPFDSEDYTVNQKTKNILENLNVGPRIKSKATIDFEIIAKAFLISSPPYKKNRLGEIEVQIQGEIFNLSKVLEHKPDFEHLAIQLESRERSLLLAQLVQLTDKYHHKQNSKLPEEEARAIYFYTMESNNSAYLKINKFMRENGKIDDIEPGKAVDLKLIISILTLASQGILRLRKKSRNSLAENQQLHRGETYKSIQEINQVRGKRISSNTSYEAGFFSTSANQKVVEEFFAADQHSKELKIKISLQQKNNEVGVDIKDYSRCTEQEVIFIPGSQFIYDQQLGNENNFQAIPVRSLDDIYPFNYDKEVLKLRSDILSSLDKYSTSANKINQQIVKMTEQYCLNLCTYAPGEKAQDIQQTQVYIQELTKLNHGDGNINLDTQINALIEIAKKILLLSKKQLKIHVLESNATLLEDAAEVYRNYLSLPFDEPEICADDLELIDGGQVIVRPNHGLAHTLRVALYIPVICATFKKYALDHHFIKFISDFNQSTITLIQTAILFSVSGRGSEVSFSQNQDKYYEYRENSEKQFLTFIENHPNKFAEFSKGYIFTAMSNLHQNNIENAQENTIYMNEYGDFVVRDLTGKVHQGQINIQKLDFNDLEELLSKFEYHLLKKIESKIQCVLPRNLIKIMAEQVKYMGNPDYYKRISDTGDLEKVTFLNVINTAHKLDLMRCYQPKQYTDNIKSLILQIKLPLNNLFTHRGMPVLLEMAMNSIIATGDRLLTKYENGSFVESKKSYDKSIFTKTNTDPKACITACFNNIPIYSITQDTGLVFEKAFTKFIGGNALYNTILSLNRDTTESLMPIESLLKEGVHIDNISLNLAMKKKSMPILQLLSKYGINPNYLDPEGNSLLSLAAAANNLEFMTQLKRKGAELNLAIGTEQDKQSGISRTALHAAIEAGNLEAFTFLLDNGANAKIDGIILYAATLNAATGRSATHFGFIELLFKHGANLCECNAFGCNVLYYVLKNTDGAKCCSLEQIQFLIDNGVPVNVEGDHNQEQAPLNQALKNQCPIEIIHLLLDKQAKIDIRWIAEQVKLNNNHYAKLLLDEFKKDINYNINKKIDGYSLLFTAIYYGNTEIAEQLLNRGAKSDALTCTSTSQPYFPLLMAIEKKFPDSFIVNLIKSGNIKNVDSDIEKYSSHHTPLLAIISRGNPSIELVKLLLLKGADPNFKGKNDGISITPLELAKNKNLDNEIITVLESASRYKVLYVDLVRDLNEIQTKTKRPQWKMINDQIKSINGSSDDYSDKLAKMKMVILENYLQIIKEFLGKPAPVFLKIFQPGSDLAQCLRKIIVAHMPGVDIEKLDTQKTIPTLYP